MSNLLVILVVVLVYMTSVFVVAWSRKRLDVVDIAWGGGFIVVALTSFAMGRMGPLQLLTTGLVLLWGFRLSYYILRRFLTSSGEDPRYTDIRKTWKTNPAANAYVRIFLTQGLLAIVVSAGVIMINLSGIVSITWLPCVGVAIWVIGFMFESIGDAQLKKHLTNPYNKNKLMTNGLWRYTRHPNYFGESTQWWGIYIIALSLPGGWASIVSPLTITCLLLFVSGVPLAERRFEGRQGWSEYKKRTSIFIPLPTKH